MVFMSKKKFDSLPQAARAVIEQNAMENESRVFGAFWDKIAREGRDSVKGTTKHTIVEPGAEQLAKWRERVSPVVDEWAKSTPNGEELLAQFRQTFAEVQTGK
jgi:TRAP-type C4-dicarboxylate transport system substrate-binding protein